MHQNVDKHVRVWESSSGGKAENVRLEISLKMYALIFFQQAETKKTPIKNEWLLVKLETTKSSQCKPTPASWRATQEIK